MGNCASDTKRELALQVRIDRLEAQRRHQLQRYEDEKARQVHLVKELQALADRNRREAEGLADMNMHLADEKCDLEEKMEQLRVRFKSLQQALEGIRESAQGGGSPSAPPRQS